VAQATGLSEATSTLLAVTVIGSLGSELLAVAAFPRRGEP
jgi:hypothetical protein